jgi:hypothetical protein
MQKIAPPIIPAPKGGPAFHEPPRKPDRVAQIIAAFEFICGAAMSKIAGEESTFFTDRALGVLPTQTHAVAALMVGSALAVVSAGALAVAAHGALILWLSKET